MIRLNKKLKDGSSIEVTPSDENQAKQLLKDPRFSRVGAEPKVEKPEPRKAEAKRPEPKEPQTGDGDES